MFPDSYMFVNVRLMIKNKLKYVIYGRFAFVICYRKLIRSVGYPMQHCGDILSTESNFSPHSYRSCQPVASGWSKSCVFVEGTALSVQGLIC